MAGVAARAGAVGGCGALHLGSDVRAWLNGSVLRRNAGAPDGSLFAPGVFWSSDYMYQGSAIYDGGGKILCRALT